MSNNDGATVAQYMAVGEELSRAMVELEHLREENERLREALRHYVLECDCNRGTFIWHDDITGKDLVRDCPKCEPARAALGEKE